jgi:hypothetical protein
MISLETRVNGAPIGCIYIREDKYDDKNGTYDVDYHQFNKKPSVINFKIKHKKEENPAKLALFVYGEIQKRLEECSKKD